MIVAAKLLSIGLSEKVESVRVMGKVLYLAEKNIYCFFGR